MKIMFLHAYAESTNETLIQFLINVTVGFVQVNTLVLYADS